MLNNNIQIALLEISPQNKAVLEFYFENAGKKLYSIVPKSMAEAFIIDYDQFGAREHVSEILETSKQPIILISIKEQNIPSTVWLAKPLSAAAFNKAADSVNILIAESKIKSAETLIEDQIKTPIENLTKKDELALDKPLEEPNELEELNALEEKLSSENTEEINDVTIEADETKENNLIEAGLALTGVSVLVAKTLESNDDEVVLEEHLTEELNDITESEDDVDALLNSLMSDDEPTVENQRASTFDLHDSIEAELQETELKNAKFKEIKTESLEFENTILDEDDLLIDNNAINKTSNNTKEHKSIIEEESESLLIDEDFTLHDDLNPLTENTYADTLEINYAEVESEETNNISEQLSNKLEELRIDTQDLSTDGGIDLTPNVKKALDDNIRNVNIESNISDDTTRVSLDSKIESEITLLDNDVKDTDLDNLLKEVSIESDSIDLNQPDEKEIKSIIAEISSLENNVDDSISGAISSDSDSDSDLESILNEVREEADKNNLDNNRSVFNTNFESQYDQTEAEKRWMQLCGNLNNITTQKEVDKISYDQEKYLLGIILQQIKSVTDKDKKHLYRWKYNGLIIVIDHIKKRVYCNTSLMDDGYSEICFNELNQKNIKVHDLDYSEEKLYHSKMDNDPEKTHTIEYFIWSTSLLTSRGRLPKNTNITTKIGLKTWPNLTRLELIPHAMHMAAVFSKNPGSLLEITDWLNIQQRYVFAFYNAALSLDMIELDSKKLKKLGFSFGNDNSEKKSNERGFFGRLLNRLKS